jgi:hypothetical protein
VKTIDGIKIVVIDNPYANWDDNFTREMFSKIIDLKKRCYTKYYGESYAPVDKWDFHGTHMSICIPVNGVLTPVVSMRTVTNKRCEEYGHKFNGLGLLDSTDSIRHKSELQKYISSNKLEDEIISTTSGLAFEPESRHKRFLVEMFIPLYVYSYINGGWDRGVIIGACASGLNKLYSRSLGYEYLNHNEEQLSSIKIPSCGNQLFDVMTIQSLASDGLTLAREHIQLWQNRIHIGEDQNLVDDYFKMVMPRAG